MKNGYTYYITVILSILLSTCTAQKKDSTISNASLLRKDSIHIKEIDTLIVTDAPSKISRKIRRNNAGHLMITAFSDVMLYDGKSFSKLPKPQGFESFDAFDAFEDSKGNTWIASTEHGVFRYDGRNFKHFTVKDGLAHNRTIDIYEDSKGNIWIATMGGVSRYNGNSFQNLTTKEGLTNNDVNTLMEDQNGNVWIGTRGALSYYNPSTAAFKEIIDNNGESLTNIRSILQDKKGNIWLAGEDGIWRYKDTEINPVSDQGAHYIYEDSSENIWLTNGSTLSFFTNASLTQNNPKATALFSEQGMFFGVSEDREGAIWVGTLQGVLSYYGTSIRYYKNAKP